MTDLLETMLVETPGITLIHDQDVLQKPPTGVTSGGSRATMKRFHIAIPGLVIYSPVLGPKSVVSLHVTQLRTAKFLEISLLVRQMIQRIIQKFVEQVHEFDPGRVLFGLEGQGFVGDGYEVPMLLVSQYVRPSDVREDFGERACASGTFGRLDSVKLMNLLLAHSLKLKKFGA